jgi:hypothetical protein
LSEYFDHETPFSELEKRGTSPFFKKKAQLMLQEIFDWAIQNPKSSKKVSTIRKVLSPKFVSFIGDTILICSDQMVHQTLEGNR